MTDSKSILEQCFSIKFGSIPHPKATDLYRRLNDQVTVLHRTLPASLQGEAMLFSLKYAGLHIGDPLDFFKHYYQPVWSVLYWLLNGTGNLKSLPDDLLESILCGHAMAMTLHSLDDHLVDGNIPVSHLTLLIRTEAWRRMSEAIDCFCADFPGGSELAQSFIDDYYSGITVQDTPDTLDAYCELFRKQLATGLIMPLLVARKTGGDDAFLSGLRAAIESFGIAWRLLDDIQDLEADMADGTHSAVYVCLDNITRAMWDNLDQGKGQRKDKIMEKICAKVSGEKILETIAARIVAELDNAALLTDGIGLPGLAEEYRVLAGPVREWIRKLL